MTIPARLNHYSILGELGKGGMGEVYLAEDTRLHRRIAIKILSPALASDPERRQRFEREAQAIAALNHPNIVTIYSVEEADGLPFLTMELVEGRPLSELIPAAGLPLDMLLRVGVSVSDAIAAAHNRGITHRDLKPGNVVITPEGRAKVLDFGLAKLREAELDADGLTRMPSGDLTGEGRIIGTVAYMSPEQAEGKAIDSRSDIFSLGVMLHEMSTGQRPFRGDTNVSVLSSILKDAPASITDINPALPAGLGRIVRRSLAKDPSRRYQTATDLRNELEELKQEIDSGITTSMPPARPAARRSISTRVAIGAVVTIAILLASVFAVRQIRAPRQSGAAAVFDAGRFTRLTNTGNAFMAAVSPDGRYVAHIKYTGALPALWMRQSATQSDVQIVPPAQVRYDGVNYSPDGDYVYYVTYAPAGGVGTLFKVATLGGQPQRILEDVDSHIAFSPDRRQITFIRGVPTEGRNYVMIAHADGTAARRLATVDPPDQILSTSPAWSPDGATIVQSGLSLRDGPHAAIFAIDVKSGKSSPVGGRWKYTGDMEWMPDGRTFLIVATEVDTAGAQVWQVAFPSGERHRVTNDLNNYAGVSLSADARTLVTVQNENLSNLWVAQAKDPARAAQVTRGRGRGDGLSGLGWTPDGRIVYGSVASGRPEIWIMNADGSGDRQLTNDPAPSVQPAVSPDGKYIVFQRFTPQGICLWRMSIDGSDPIPLTTGGVEFQPVIGADSRLVYFSSSASGQPIAHRIPIDGGTPTRLSDIYFRPVSASRDGRLLLGVSWDPAGRRSVLATLPVEGGSPHPIPDVPTGAATWAPSPGIVTYADVSPDGVSLLNVPIEGGKPVLVTKVEENLFTFAWSPDGRQMAIARGVNTSDVVLIAAKTEDEKKVP